MVIFLDIDGVLNSEAYVLKLEKQHYALGHGEPASPETTCDCFKLYQQIDRDAIDRVNRIVAETGAKIVISSTWRKLFDPPVLAGMLAAHGLMVGEIIGETPEGHDHPGMLVVYGNLERMYRGYEIDYWLRQHPDVERFVILDDGSDMVMHKNRLVQTDCQEGLLDEHVELAIRVLAWDGKTAHPFEQKEAEDSDAEFTRQIREQARVEGYAIHYRHYRLHQALPAETPCGETIAKLKLYEFSIQRSLVTCEECLAQTPPEALVTASEDSTDDDDVLAELRAQRQKHEQEARAAVSAFVDQVVARGLMAASSIEIETIRRLVHEEDCVARAAKQPGSSVGLHCDHGVHLREGGCPERLVLRRSTAVQPSHEDDYQHLFGATHSAAVLLGWRVHKGGWWCPTHVVAKKLACKRCLLSCPACSCVGGPWGEAVDGLIVSLPPVSKLEEAP